MVYKWIIGPDAASQEVKLSNQSHGFRQSLETHVVLTASYTSEDTVAYFSAGKRYIYLALTNANTTRGKVKKQPFNGSVGDVTALYFKLTNHSKISNHLSG